MEDELFRRFCDIAYAQAGIRLRDGKQALVMARVAKRLRALRLATPREYLEVLEGDSSGNEIVSFLDAISTNHTSFFREPSHFERLTRFIEQRLAQGRTRLRVWCAAASTGEEPYTLAVSVAEAVGKRSCDWRILATDISTKALATAAQATYSEEAVARVPRLLVDKYFVRSGSENEGLFQVAAQLRQRVLFKRLNLAVPPYPMPGPLDVVFCRNVMIYFDGPVRQRVVSEIDRLLAADGLLCVGHSETLTGLQTRLAPVEPSIYQMRGTNGFPAHERTARRAHGSS